MEGNKGRYRSKDEVLVPLELNFSGLSARYGFALKRCGFKPVLSCGLNGLVVESSGSFLVFLVGILVGAGFDDVDVLNMTVRVDHELNRGATSNLSFDRLIRERRLDRVGKFWGNNALAAAATGRCVGIRGRKCGLCRRLLFRHARMRRSRLQQHVICHQAGRVSCADSCPTEKE